METFQRKDKIAISVKRDRLEKRQFHPDTELIFVLNGTVELTIDEHSYSLKKDDIYVINPNKFHEMENSEDVLYASINIANELISDILKSTQFMFWCDMERQNSLEMDKLRSVLREMLNDYNHGRESVITFHHISLCYQMMDILAMNFLVKKVNSEKNPDDKKYEERKNIIDNYIWSHYNQEISLKDLADQLYISEAYLSRFFKKSYGMNFAKYVNSVRLYHAADELLYSNKPITKIAYDNGFSGLSVFNKVFKESNGMSPTQMRRTSAVKVQNTGGSNEKTEEIRHMLAQYLAEELHPADTQLDLKCTEEVIDVNEQEPLHRYWSDMINLGAADKLYTEASFEQLKLLKDEMKFKYVRIWNIFAKEMMIDLYAIDQKCNFSHVDAVLDNIIRAGLRPEIDFTLKPKRINKNAQEAVVHEDVSNEYITSLYWIPMMDAFVEHIVKRYGLEEVNEWRFELSHFTEDWDNTEKNKKFFSMFNDTYECIHTKIPLAEIGGGALQSGIFHSSNTAFIESWGKADHQPDYLTMIHYPYVKGVSSKGEYSKRDSDLYSLDNAVDAIHRDAASAGWSDKQIYVTEWNITISDRNSINDSLFKGAYVLANILKEYGKIPVLGYHLASDSVMEYYDSAGLLNGSPGILTRNSIYKPSAYAYWFLHFMRPFLIKKTDQYMITGEGDEYSIVCHHMMVLNYRYYYTRENEIERQNMSQYFDDHDASKFIYKLNGIKPGEYEIRRFRLTHDFGSVLDMWKKMGFKNDMPISDANYIKKVCFPNIEIKMVTVKENDLKLEIDLEPNEVSLIELKRQ